MQHIRSWLSIGKYRETLDRTLLHQVGIQALLHLAERVTHPNIACLYLPIEDGVALDIAQLRSGIAFVVEYYHQQHHILIACGAGVSRSVTFTIAALIELENLSLWEAYATVRQQHPDAMPHPALWESLCTYYGEPIAYLRLLK